MLTLYPNKIHVKVQRQKHCSLHQQPWLDYRRGSFNCDTVHRGSAVCHSILSSAKSEVFAIQCNCYRIGLFAISNQPRVPPAFR